MGGRRASVRAAKEATGSLLLNPRRRVERDEGNRERKRPRSEKQDGGEKTAPQARPTQLRCEPDHPDRRRRGKPAEEGEREGVLDVRPAKRLACAKEADVNLPEEAVDRDPAGEKHGSAPRSKRASKGNGRPPCARLDVRPERGPLVQLAYLRASSER
jgi:hypothetical protein